MSKDASHEQQDIQEVDGSSIVVGYIQRKSLRFLFLLRFLIVLRVLGLRLIGQKTWRILVIHVKVKDISYVSSWLASTALLLSYKKLLLGLVKLKGSSC